MNTFQELLLKEVLYPCVRVRTAEAGGSGTVIYSRPSPTTAGEFDTYVVTCHHVIDDAIKLRDEWDPLLQKERKKEHRQRILVEEFKYKYGSRAVGANSAEADIEVWNRQYDLAVLKLRTIEQFPFVAKMFPFTETSRIQLLDNVYAVGCALGHPPVLTSGHITSMSDEVESVSYWMSNAQIIFGNSGGAMFHAEKNEFIGVPSMVSIYGWGNAVTHMGYFSDIERIYKWLKDECYQFLFDSSFTVEECKKMREEKKSRELEIFKKQEPSVERPRRPEPALGTPGR